MVFNNITVKYDYLDEVLKPYLDDDIAFNSNVNMYIDLREFVKKTVIDMAIERISKAMMITNIVNIIAHYRHYFAKYIKYTSFAFVYSLDILEATCEYDMMMDSHERKDDILECIKLAGDIINKIPSATFIDTSAFGEFLVVRRGVELSASNDFNIILSTDRVFCQLMNSNTVILTPAGYNTKLISSKNVFSRFVDEDEDTYKPFSSKLISLLMSMIGAKSLGIKNIPKIGAKKAISYISKRLAANDIYDSIDYINIPTSFFVDDGTFVSKTILSNENQIRENYAKIKNDAIYYVNDVKLASLFIKPDMIFEKEFFLDINSRLFVETPLLLHMLFEGENI